MIHIQINNFMSELNFRRNATPDLMNGFANQWHRLRNVKKKKNQETAIAPESFVHPPCDSLSVFVLFFFLLFAAISWG
jgi:hypothetical protein